MPHNTLTLRGAHTWYWGFEITNSDPSRTYSRRVNIDDAGSADRVRGTGVHVVGPHLRCINLVVHDTLNGIFVAASATNAQLYGVITYYNGVADAARGHGHGVYIQNREGSKRIEDVIAFGNHATGMKAYGEDGWAQGVHFEGVVSFNNGVGPPTAQPVDKMENLFVGTTTHPADRIEVIDSVFYHRPETLGSNVTLGYQHQFNGTLKLEGNQILGGSLALTVKYWTRATIVRNTLYATTAYNRNSDQSLAQVVRPARARYEWNRNVYIDGTRAARPFAVDEVVNEYGGGNLGYDEWRPGTGFDARSSYSLDHPSKPTVTVRPNRYEAGRAHIIVMNWSGADQIAVDLNRAGLSRGDAFEIRDAQNLRGEPVLIGHFSGQLVRLSLSGLVPVRPVGELRFYPLHTAPRFAVFVVRKTARL